MLSRFYLINLLSFLLVITGGMTLAQAPSTPSPQKRLAATLARYQSGRLSDTSYLKEIDSIAPQLLNDDSLTEDLSTYRQIAFGNKDLGKYRMWYYRYLAIFSINKNKYGSAIYYSEKNNEEAVKIGVFEKEGIPHSDLFAVAVYENNKDYPRLIAKYNTLAPQLTRLPSAIPAGKVSGEQGFVVLSIMNSAVVAFYKTNDTLHGGDGIRLYEAMLKGIRQQPEKYKRYMAHYYYGYHMMCYERAKYLGHFDSAQSFLEMAISEVRSPDYLKNLQTSTQVSTYAEAFDFYFGQKRNDSAQHYLSLIRAIKDSPIGFAGIEQSILLESETKLLGARGDFQAAYHALEKLYQMKDSAFHAVSADKDNNLYALAEGENTRNELIRSEARQQRAEKFNFFLILFFTVLVFGGIAVFFVYRSAQRHRLLNLRLGLARNFHDEIGPMLLYASTLTKKEMEAHPSPRLEELKNQIGYVMEAVRGISHDLKSNQLSTVHSFYKDVTTLLEKMRASTGVEFTIRMNDGNRILGHLQYIHLRKIVDEMVSNSIKHAGCTLITLRIRAAERRLMITYSDNGKGMASEKLTGGIGIQNMQERASLINGDFLLHNAWPEGYSIDISIPLL